MSTKKDSEHVDGLQKILDRIPDECGPWISCGPGWHPLLIELDQKLAAIAPDYQVYQVKEKFGTLRYYIGFPDLQPQCCLDLDTTQPVDGPIDPRYLRRGEERTLEQQHTLDKWFYETRLPHYDTPEHKAADAALEPERQQRQEQSQRMNTIIDEHEDRSATICEQCGKDGQLRDSHGWYQTLCDQCWTERERR